MIKTETVSIRLMVIPGYYLLFPGLGQRISLPPLLHATNRQADPTVDIIVLTQINHFPRKNLEYLNY